MPHETGFEGRKTSADYAVKGVTSPALGGSIMMSRLMAMDVTSRGVRSCAAHTMKNEIAKRRCGEVASPLSPGSEERAWFEMI